jgi:hypothetical protein
MKKNQKPYHIEARELGINDFGTIKGINYKRISANDLRAIWDYRAAGLKIDDARAKLEAWNRRSYHRYQRGQRQIETHSTGRILNMAKRSDANMAAYRKGLKAIMTLPDATLDWTCPRVRWEIGGRSIVTVRHNDVTWSEHRRHHWPTSSTVSYTSHLIRTTDPGTIEAYKINEYDILSAATECKIPHDLRGNWQVRIVKELLNIDWAPEKEIAVFYKKVAVCPAFPTDVFASVYDGSPYIIGVPRYEKAMKNHNGGLYCYKTAAEAHDAPFPDSSTLKNAKKCILAVQVRGKRIRYENGKYAVSEMTPMEVVTQ